MAELRFDVFGRTVIAAREADSWALFYTGEGKRRPAHDIAVPGHVTAEELARYLADLCHEWATQRYPGVRRLDRCS